MSEDNEKRFDRSLLHTYPVQSRPSKVAVGQFAKPPGKGATFADFMRSLPDILAAGWFKQVVGAIRDAMRLERPVLVGMGAHPLKCGLGPVLIDGMRRGWISGLALNGAGVIHDFEIATIGTTSEEVGEHLADGSFGMAEETGKLINEAFASGVAKGWGLGRSIGEFLCGQNPPFAGYSVVAAAHTMGVPVSVHVAIGTDIIHMHPSCSGEVLGEGSMRDFLMFTELVADLEGGGVYLNFGSAVILPEVLLKAVSMVRNAGRPLREFTTANFDFLKMYRPTENVVKRPVAEGGKGFSITGHHEILIPLLAFALSL